ncbi:hypothetical protein GGI26_002603 [Coemansia sp. RSA 1358]|nr:hypothetical protein GGI26_002603 [Coemansia sp. RSA 1358]
MLSDEHLFDAASVPFPETPKTINSVNSSVVLPVPQGEMRDQSVVSASHIQRERTTSAPAASPPCTNDDPNTLRRLSQGANIGLPATLPRDDGRLHQKNCQLDYADMLHKLHEEYEAREMAREQQVKEMLHDAEARHKREIEETKKEFEQLLSRQTQKLQEQKIKYQKEANEATAEREELQYMLEEYIATSGKLIQQKEIEVDGFTRELRKVTLERQKLQQSVSECEAHANVLTGERNEAQERAKLLMTENARLEELNKNLHNDILVAEERSKLIKSHAQETLSKANTEISRLQKFLTQAKQDIAALRSQTAKVDARAKSLQIQLNSTKQQNKDLLVLCERFDGSLV